MIDTVEPPVRRATAADAREVVALFDDAVAWMNARGNTEQWGTVPWSQIPTRVRTLEEWCARDDGPWVALLPDGRIGGFLVVGDAHPYVPPATGPELYIVALISSREPAARGFGRRLLRHADELAARAGIVDLRVDCYAGGDGRLVRFYESAGYTADAPFRVKEWPGQLLRRRLEQSVDAARIA